MDIINITDYYGVKLSERSITAKDENGKTRGVVKATRFKAAPPRVQIDYSKQARAIMEAGKLDNLYISDGRLFYINSANSLKYYNDERFQEAFSDEIARYNALMDKLASIEGLTVLTVKTL